MSRWWRAEDTSIDHPKLLRLSDAMHRAWYTLMCVASANDGELPPAADIALRLRVKPAKVAEWITVLVAAELFDRGDDGVFRPHNWSKRQYKTDVTDPTNAQRQKRYRERHRNGSNAVTDKRPETEQTTEQKSETERETRARELSPISEDFELTEADIDVAHNAGMTDATLDTERKLFIARKQSDGKQSANWSAEWRIWCDRWKAMKKPNEAPPPADPSKVDHDALLRLYARTGVWSRHAGPEPGQIGCVVPQELFAKHGLLPDGRKINEATH